MKENSKKQPIVGCWYYDHNVCGLPHPSPICDEHDTSIRKDEREKVLLELLNEFLDGEICYEGQFIHKKINSLRR